MSKENEAIDYGPLTMLIGSWAGDRGHDISPEPEGTEENPYYETLVFTPQGDVDNAEEQRLIVLSYEQIVRRKSNDKVFHHQVGHWMWDPATNEIMQSLSIPRGVCCLAGGVAAKDFAEASAVTLEVTSTLGDKRYGVVESPFMAAKASTLAYTHRATVSEDRLRYRQVTTLSIYGRTFEHSDTSLLLRQTSD